MEPSRSRSQRRAAAAASSNRARGMDPSRSRSKRLGRLQRISRAVKSAAASQASTGSAAAAASQPPRRSKSSSGSDHAVQAALAKARRFLVKGVKAKARPRASKSPKVAPLDLGGYESGKQIDDMDVEGFLRPMEQISQRRLKFVVLRHFEGKTVRTKLPRLAKLSRFNCDFEVCESSPSGAAAEAAAAASAEAPPKPQPPPRQRRSRIRTPTPSGAALRRGNCEGSAGAPEVGLAPPPLPPPLLLAATAAAIFRLLVPAPLPMPPPLLLPPEPPAPATFRRTLLFDADVANGIPTQWSGGTIYWGKATQKKYFANVVPAVPDVNDVLSFLQVRLGPDGQPVAHKLGDPQEMERGVWRLPWKGFEEPTVAMGPRDGTWERAWHGTKMEALYSIMYHGRLCASHMEGSHRFFKDKPGVYIHGEHSKNKAEGYARFVSLTQSGIFWSATWELRVDRSDRVPLSKSSRDQWAQTEKSCRLAALWVRGRSIEEMESGWPLATHWIPEHEGNPIKHQFAS